MKILRSYFHRLRSLYRSERLDRELNDELAAHLEMHVADNLRAGLAHRRSPGEKLEIYRRLNYLPPNSLSTSLALRDAWSCIGPAIAADS